LQILDEGRLTDSCGTPVSFADSIVIVTSNSVSGANIGFGSSKRASDQALSFLPKELLDRFDDVIEFSPLSYENVCRIADIKLQSLAEKMKKRGVKLAFDPGFSHEAIGENAGSARTASRAALRKAEDALSLALLEGRLKSGDEAVIFCEKGDCRLKITQKAY
ncbi:MAG: ATP-dependent Clp protease ATP-binding subunit, partial [Clostridia bacterium]|nr:ATP-dependent Clp protease ATP-binding subunit [Clostridia bacterium]